ncbi:ABC transporter permease [Bifidobacterium ruminantium]|jgi:putative ABC transport system permease protein|uniref:ABC transporter permease n=1 Tax=Bifidobacterium TaxID=1678 RepID=UPI00255C8316|nr:FtsX-like permease family protein [Bifidobacterium ruminantium]MEE0970907.1 FtsX-like permease family protein [Bifidobacterium ruminantium]
MFFLNMIFRSFSRQFKRRLLIAVTVCLSATVSVAMLGVVFDVGDKLNAELSTYGSNIIVQPKSDAVVSDLYGSGDSGTSSATSTASGSSSDPTSFLKESDAKKIKTIFWAFNITNFAPELNIHADAGCSGTSQGSCKAANVPIVGTWFAKTLHMDSGESTVVGVDGMRSWWKVSGTWPKDGGEQAMAGSAVAAKLGLKIGDSVTLDKTIAASDGNGTERNRVKVKIVGIFDSGDSDDNAIYMPSIMAQTLANLPDSVDKIEVKALTTPDNDLARKASKNPAALTQDEWETWYCTAYPSSIAYQIEEVLPGAVAKQVRQVAALQGDVLNKTQAVMVLMTVLSLVAAAIAVANLMAASIGERGSELALLKAIGATDGAVSRLMLAETAVVALAGAIVGALLGSGVAQIVGHVVFGSGITMRPMVFVLVFVLLAVTILVASLSSIRAILGLKPAEVLHGR